MKIGLLGYGDIAKKHQAALADAEFGEIVAIYDILPVEDSQPAYYNDLDKFVAAELDLISICSPNGLHKTHSIKALKNGHHVICEKPFALSSADCQEMITTADRHGKEIFCTMQNRFSPVSQWLKKLVQEKALGEIYLINIACYWNRNKAYYQQSDWRGKKAADGGTLFTQFSHYVDTIYWLFGSMNILNAHFKNFDHGEMIEFEDTGIFNFTLDQGGMGTFSYTTSCYEKNFESSMTIISSKGTIKVAGQYMDRVVYSNLQAGKTAVLDSNNNLSNIKKVYETSIGRIKGLDTEACSAQDGLAVVELIEKVYSFRK